MKTVLIVDDTEDIREALKEVLLNEGCNVLTAENGEEGLKTLQENKVNLIILDTVMHIMDGWEFRKKRKLM